MKATGVVQRNSSVAPQSTVRTSLSTPLAALLLGGVFSGVLSFSAFASSEVTAPATATGSELEAQLQQLQDNVALFSEDALHAALVALKPQLATAEPSLQRRFDQLYCRVAHVPSDNNTALEFANQGLIAARQQGDVRVAAQFMLCQGSHLALIGEVATAETAFNAAYQQAVELNDARLQAEALSARGDFYSYTANLGKALSDLLQSQRLYEGLKLDSLATGNLSSLAHVYRRMGDNSKAREYYQAVVKRAQQLGNASIEAESLNFIGWAYIEEGQLNLARESFAASRSINARLPKTEINFVVDALHLGIVDSLQGRHQEALQSFASIAEPVQQQKYVLIRGLMLYFRGHAEAGMSQYRQALKTLNDAEALMSKLGNKRYVARILRLRSDVYAGLGQFSHSRDDLLRYLVEQKQLDEKLRADESARLRIEFDTERTVSENQRLHAEQALQQERVQALEETRRWQLAFMVLGGSVILALLIRQLRKARRLYILAMTDELTRLPNRRAIYRYAEEAWRDSGRQQMPMAVILFDIDHFKRINDNWGHDQGDQVLQQVANSARAALRGRDRMGRIGGEEFLVILPGANTEQAKLAAERLRQAVAATVFELDSSENNKPETMTVTISLGVTSRRDTDSELETVIARADAALYRSKTGGRNRVSVDEILSVAAAASV